MRILGDKNGPCKLCRLSGGPLCKSHIVPEYCYDYRKADGREPTGARQALMYHLTTASPTGNPQIVQKGYREYLLCKDCERRFNDRYEKPFCSFLNEKIKAKGEFAEGPVSFEGIDYHAVKLFILSVIWRSSVSCGFGGSLKLGAYAEKLRSILWSNRKVPQGEYPVYGNIILDGNGRPCFGFVQSPRILKLRQASVCNMALAGCEWNVVMSDHGVPKPFETWQHSITERGEITLVAMRYRKFHSVRKLARLIQQRGNCAADAD